MEHVAGFRVTDPGMPTSEFSTGPEFPAVRPGAIQGDIGVFLQGKADIRQGAQGHVAESAQDLGNVASGCAHARRLPGRPC